MKSSSLVKLVVITVIVVVAIQLFLSFAFHAPLKHWDLPLQSLALTTGFLGPIEEEIVFRGLFLSVLLLLTPRFFKQRGLSSEYALLASVFLSVIFAFLHTMAFDFTAYGFQTRFWASIVFSVAYLASDRNIKAPIAAHLASNWLLILFG